MSGEFETSPERDPARYSSRTVMWLLGSMVMIPVRAFVYGMDIFVRTMHGMQSATDRGLGVMAGESMPLGDSEPPPPAGEMPPVAVAGPAFVNPQNVQETIGKETVKMSDTNLNDDMLKLVRYKILFIKRDYEYAFPEQEELVYDNMTDSAFTAWKIAEFIQALDRTEVPEKWLNKVPPYPRERKREGNKEYIHRLDESDKKFLRVYFEVLQRYAREKLKYEEDQLDALRGIREAIEKHGIPGAHAEAGGDRKAKG